MNVEVRDVGRLRDTGIGETNAGKSILRRGQSGMSGAGVSPLCLALFRHQPTARARREGHWTTCAGERTQRVPQLLIYDAGDMRCARAQLNLCLW